MNVTAFTNLAVASFFVTQALASEPARRHLKRRAQSSSKSAAMCLVEPVDPPPCATPAAVPRATP